jgi:hypothetical protein
MRKILMIAGMALELAGCQTDQQDRALTGAVIGGAAGTAIGAAAGGSGGSAVAGGAIGAAAGGIIGAQTSRGGRCYAVDRYGYEHRVRCRRY